MVWLVSCILATLSILTSFGVVICKKIYRKNHNKPAILDGQMMLAIMFVGVALTGVFLFVPLCYYSKSVFSWSLVIYDVLQVFFLDGDAHVYETMLQNLPKWICVWYSVLTVIVYIIGPILVAGSVLNLVKGLFSNIKYSLSKVFSRGEYYIFSDLNDSSICLAESIRKQDEKAVLVFAGTNEEDLNILKFADEARNFGSIILKKDLLNLQFSRKTNVFFISQDEMSIVNRTSEFVQKHKKNSLINCYVFSDSVYGESILNTLRRDENCKMKIKRINMARTIIFNDLFENGRAIFDSAVEKDDGKHISAIVVGDEAYAAEMARNLTWFCQMPGYTVEINYFADSEISASKFKAQCPELVLKSGRIGTDQDACYTLNIFDFDINSLEFEEKVEALETPTFVFVSLGDDKASVEASMRIASLSCRKPGGEKAFFQAVVKNNICFEKIVKFGKKNEISINTIGGLAECYNIKSMMQSQLEERAMARHCKYSAENGDLTKITGKNLNDAVDAFFQSEYNYYSSMASEIHTKFKSELNVFDINTEYPQLENLRKLEHMRWNAYMRSIGYRYAEKRNDTAKQHWHLIDFDNLSESVKMLDDVKITDEEFFIWKENLNSLRNN